MDMRIPLLSILLSFNTLCAAQSPFRLDLFGYLPGEANRIVIADPQVGFNASDSYSPSNQLMVVGASSSWPVSATVWSDGTTDDRSGDAGWVIELPELPLGEYHILDVETGAISPTFEVTTTVYHQALKDAGRMFFHNRCGAPKALVHAGPWHDAEAFNHAGQDTESRYIYDAQNASLFRDVRGGWFDAGDFNKYVTFAERPVCNLMEAYAENPNAFGDDWNITESGNGLPDLLDELHWELEWVFRMTNPDGTCQNKVGSANYSQNINSPASENFDPRYYGPTCTSSSISAAHMLAKAAWFSEEFDVWTSNADSWQSRAEACWTLGVAALESSTLETNCDDGSIVAGDADRTAAQQEETALATAIYLFALTGDSQYQNFLLSRAYNLHQLNNNYWTPYTLHIGDALIRYISLPGHDNTLANDIEASLTQFNINNWENYLHSTGDNLYQAYMPHASYHWGSNEVMSAAGILQFQVMPWGNQAESVYREKALAHVHYLHGFNPLAACYLTNMEAAGAEASMTQMYHTAFGQGTLFDSTEDGDGPPPGYVVGGPNKDFTVQSISPPSGQPVEKSYLDWNDGWPSSSWEISEPSIYNQAVYVRLIANFCSEADTPAILGCTEQDACNYNSEANENDGSCEYTSCQCVGDLDGDSLVGVSDILQLLSLFGCTANCEMADINNNGLVGSADVLLVLAQFGNTCL